MTEQKKDNRGFRWTFIDNDKGRIVLYQYEPLDNARQTIIDKGIENEVLGYDVNDPADRLKISQLAAKIVESRNEKKEG